MFTNEYFLSQMSHQVQEERIKEAKQVRLFNLAVRLRRERRGK